MSDGIILYEPGAGEHISTACRKAAEIAGRRGLTVQFRFNDVDVAVAPGERPEAAEDRWNIERDRQTEAWRASPEGRRAEAEAEERRRDCQRRTDALIVRLPGVVKELGPLVRWCVELSRAADHVGVRWSPSAVADAIEAAGWRRDAHVGRAEAEFRGEPTMLGEYVVGQALSCLGHGMPPHPIVEKFAREGGFLGRKATEAP